MRDVMHRAWILAAAAVGVAATMAGCSGAPNDPPSSSNTAALDRKGAGDPLCDAICRVGTHCELAAYACATGSPGLVGPCPSVVPECLPDRDPGYPTCASKHVTCEPGEVCVDVPNDCAPPADDVPPTCPPTVPFCESVGKG